MDDREKILRSFMKDGVLLEMPSKLKKRRIVLREIASTIDASRTYTEREISDILLRTYGDYCALRRYLVDEGFLRREKGIYSVSQEVEDSEA